MKTNNSECLECGDLIYQIFNTDAEVFKVIKVNGNNLVSCFNVETGEIECFGLSSCVSIESEQGKLITEAKILRGLK